jgi:hypothetical protein
MTRILKFLTQRLSALVAPTERDAVMGDLAELKLGSLQTIFELCGLIVRQQAPLWNGWRPWLALLGIAGLVGIRLNVVAHGLTAWPYFNIRTYLKYATFYHDGMTTGEELLMWLSMAAGVLLWSWTAGFAFTSIAGKSAYVTGVLICAMWLAWNGFMLARALVVLPWLSILQLIPLVLFFIPAIWGARRAYRGGNLSRPEATILLLVTMSVVALVTWTSGLPQAGLERWSEGAIHGGAPWYHRLLPYLLYSLPAAWIVANGTGVISRFQRPAKNKQ